ncbi:hypothetical protein Tco_1226339 [Tanacetum coccineum]
MSTPDYMYPVIVPSVSDIKDPFFLYKYSDYTPASPDYFPTSPGNASPYPSDDLSKYLLASLAISPVHDDPYMKVMQAYNATSNELPIPPQAHIAPPTVLPPSPLLPLSPISHKTSLERHEEQIDTILNHLDELPLERIEHIEDIIEGLGNGRVIIQRDFDQLETKLHEARAQIAGFQRKQVGNDDEIVLARVRTSTLNILIEDIQIHHRSDIKSVVCLELQKQRANHWKQLATRADKSFVSISLAFMLNIPSITLDTTYDIEMADGNLVGTNTIIQGCTLILLNQPFEIDLMPIKLGSFDVVIAQVLEKKSDEKRLEDKPVVKEFSEVFPEELHGLPPVRQVEFQIDLIPRRAPVAQARYRLAPLEMQELSDQL